MKRLLDEFATMFNLDYRVQGTRLGELVERAINQLEQRPLPDWGSSGPAHRFEVEHARSLDFYYTPHLFPEMSLPLRLAHKLQFYMLPREVPPDAPMSITTVLESYCHLSGDLFGWELLADGRFLIWIVDLAGHGVKVGLSSAILKVLIDNLRQRERVSSMVTELNETFTGCLRLDNSNLHATGFFMALSSDGSADYTSAGHQPVLLRRNDARIEELSSNGLPIGMFPGQSYTATRVRLGGGDTMLLYTDGLVESINEKGEHFGLARLHEHLRAEYDSPQSLAHSHPLTDGPRLCRRKNM